MASFASVSAALEAAVAIQRDLANENRTARHPLELRIGMAAGEPVLENNDLFGAAVQLAARLCDRAGSGSILVSGAVRDLAIGKHFVFPASGPADDEGVRRADQPVRGRLAAADRPGTED